MPKILVAATDVVKDGGMPKILVAATDVVKDGGQTQCQELRALSIGGEFVWHEDRQKL